jgi:hypothetical protein
MPARQPIRRFVMLNVAVWLAMTIILIVVPDVLERWVPLAFGRALGWAVAGGVWIIVIERHWQARMGVAARFFGQVLLWGSAALTAIWISDSFRA